MLREVFQQRFIGKKALWQPFGIVETFAGNNVACIAQLFLHGSHFRRQWPFGHLFNTVWLNPDRIDLSHKGIAKGAMLFVTFILQLRKLTDAVQERHPIGFSLEAQQVIFTQHFQ